MKVSSRIREMFRRTVQFTGLAAGLMLPVAVHAQQQVITQSEQTITVERGKTALLRLGYVPRALSVGDSAIADLRPTASPQEFLINGLTVGSTTIIIWDQNNLAHLMSAAVVIDATALQTQLNTVFPNAGVTVTPSGDAVIVSVNGHEMPMTAHVDGPLLGAILDSPLMRFATARLRQLDTDAVLAGNSAGYALERSPRALAVVVLFFALVGYAFTDTVVNTDAYAGEPPYGLFAGWGVLGAGLAWLWMRAGEVPALERGVVALLLGAALGAALHPGLLRVNAATDADGPHTYRYRLLDDLTLQPPLQGLPPLDFSRYREYWRQFRPGSTHPIVLRRGALEFYQVDMAPLRAALRAFYEKQP